MPAERFRRLSIAAARSSLARLLLEFEKESGLSLLQTEMMLESMKQEELDGLKSSSSGNWDDPIELDLDSDSAGDKAAFPKPTSNLKQASVTGEQQKSTISQGQLAKLEGSNSSKTADAAGTSRRRAGDDYGLQGANSSSKQVTVHSEWECLVCTWSVAFSY